MALPHPLMYYGAYNVEWDTIYTVRKPTELARIIQETRRKSDIMDKIVQSGRRYNYAAIDAIMSIPEVELDMRRWSTHIIAGLEGRDRARVYIFGRYPHWREIVKYDLLERPGEFPKLERYMANMTFMRR